VNKAQIGFRGALKQRPYAVVLLTAIYRDATLYLLSHSRGIGWVRLPAAGRGVSYQWLIGYSIKGSGLAHILITHAHGTITSKGVIPPCMYLGESYFAVGAKSGFSTNP